MINKKTIYTIFSYAFGIRPEEFKIVNLFLLYLTVLYTGYTIISTAALSLFLGRVDSITLHNLLPWLYIAIAVVVTLVAKVYQLFIDKFSRIKLIVYTTGFFILSFLILQTLAVNYAKTWVYALLMIWDETSCVILIMVFYSYLGDYFFVYNARRLYAYITGGMALGAPIGGFGAAFLLNYITTPNLIFVGIILHAFAIVLAYLIYQNNVVIKEKISQKKISTPIFQSKLLFNKYLCLLFLVGAFPIVFACLDSYQMFYVASKTLNEKELGVFMGKFYGYAGLMLLVIDFLLAKWFRNRSIFTNLLIMPILLVFTCIAFVVNPILIYAASIKFVDNILNNTVNTFTFQVLFLPLSERIRSHAQAISAGVMTAGAKILGGSILVILSFFYIPIQIYTIILLIIVLCWIVCTLFLIPLYKKELASSISKNVSAIEFEKIINHPKANEVIQYILNSSDNNAIIVLLKAFKTKSFQKYQDEVKKLLTHPEPEIAREALNTYGIFGDFQSIYHTLPEDLEDYSMKSAAIISPRETEVSLLKQFLDEKLSDSEKSNLLTKMSKLNLEIALPYILNEIDEQRSFILIVDAYHALIQAHQLPTLSTPLKNKIQLSREKVLQKIIILRQAYQEMRSFPPVIRQLYIDSIYFYAGILSALLRVEYQLKELIQLKNLIFDHNEQQIYSLIELLETVVSNKEAEKLKKVFSPFNQTNFILDVPSQDTVEKLLALDPWINSLTIYAMGETNKMKPKNSVYFDYIETILFLKQVNLFKEIPVNFLSPIAEAICEETFSPNDFIFKEGESSNSLFIIKSGSVKIQTDKKDIIQLKVGEAFGELALLENLPHSASAYCLENTTLYRLDSVDFEKILESYPEVSKALLKILAHRLRVIALDVTNM